MRNPDRALDFGQNVDKGLEGQKAFPYIYAFTPRRDDTWDTTTVAGTLTALNGIGPTLVAGQTVQWPIVTDEDLPFKMLYLKYTAYYLNAGTFFWYDPVALWFQEQSDFQTSIGSSLVNFINVSLAVRTDSRYLYGGDNLDPVLNAGVNGLLPIPIGTIQGYDFGMGQVRTPFLAAPQTTFVLTLTNTHPTYTLTVGGMLYGMKVRV